MKRPTGRTLERRLDKRLQMLCLAQGVKYILLAMVIGAILGAIIYYIQVICKQPEVEYSSTEVFYVEYSKKPNGDINYAYNDDGWTYVTMFDEITDIVFNNLEVDVTREELDQIVTTYNLSDYKILEVTATSTNKELCVPILEAYVPAMEQYGESSIHIDYIKQAIEPSQVKPVIITNYTTRAMIVWGILGGILAFFIIWIKFLTENTYKVATSIQEDYDFPVIGTILSSGEILFQDEYNANLIEIIGDKKIATLRCSNSINLEEFKGYDGIILEIVAGKTTYASIERIINSAKIQKIDVVAMSLTNANEWLQMHFYR